MCSRGVKFCIFLILVALGATVGANSSTTVTDVTTTTETETTVTTSTSNSTTTTSSKSTSTSATVTGLPICDTLSVMPNLNLLGLSGTWYETARKGYGTFIQNLQCLQMDISYMNGTAWVYQTYAEDLQSLNNQTTYEYIIGYNITNPSSYNILSTTYMDLPVPVYKILDTDYDNYLVVCSYLPIWQKSAAAFVYFRDRNTLDSNIYAVINEAATKYGDFTNMNLVYQGQSCNSVSRTLPLNALVFILFVIYALTFKQ